MAIPPDTLRGYVELHRSGYRRFPPPYTVAAFEAVLSGWRFHRDHVAPDDGDRDADLFFKRFTDYVQMKASVFSLRYWGYIIDGEAGGAPSPIEPARPEHHENAVLERAHARFFELYDAFWEDRDAGRQLNTTPPPDGRYD